MNTHSSLLAIALFAALISMPETAQAAVQKPNIIFLMADDQSTYAVGCYGNKDVQTPEMNRLGTTGMVFDRHYDTTPICMASRATVFTGMYEYKTATNFGHGDMRTATWSRSYPVLLRQAGYLTAFAGKFGFEVEGKGLCESDFDIWGGSPGQSRYETAKNKSMAKYASTYPHSTLSYGAFGRDAIREAVKKNRPLCLSISFKAPHLPATPDPRFDAVYAGKTFTKPANFGRENGEHLSTQSKNGRQYERFITWGYEKDYDGVMRKYHQQVYAIDVALGMIRKELDAQGIADNTVIIYTSDNGFICGSHGFGSKVLPMEESARVPLMIHDPRSKTAGQGKRCRMLTGNIDVAPTILDLAGLPIPDNMDGKSLVGLLDNPAKGGHEQLALINTYNTVKATSLSAVTSKYKYTFWWYGDKNMEPAEELFDLENDPLEMVNLAGNPEFKAVLDGMRQRYDRQHARWKQQAVDYNGYQHYIATFDRNLALDQKPKGKPNTETKAKDGVSLVERRKARALRKGKNSQSEKPTSNP